jgi:hypothetical protein
MQHRDLPNWPMWANVMIIVTCAALAATLGYAMKTQDRSRMLTGHWRVQLDSVRYEVALLWPDAGIWDEVSARGHRQWLFKFGNDCALLPWDRQQRCVPMARHGDTLTIGAWHFAPVR